MGKVWDGKREFEVGDLLGMLRFAVTEPDFCRIMEKAQYRTGVPRIISTNIEHDSIEFLMSDGKVIKGLFYERGVGDA